MCSIQVLSNTCTKAICYFKEQILLPVETAKQRLEEVATSVQKVFGRLIQSIQNLYSDCSKGIYENRFFILYLSLTSAVALHDLPLFIGSACVGSVFSLIFSDKIPKNSERNSAELPQEAYCKNYMLLQSAFTLVHGAAQVLAKSQWVSYSNESPIAAALSGCLFGNLLTKKISKIFPKI